MSVGSVGSVENESEWGCDGVEYIWGNVSMYYLGVVSEFGEGK